MNRTNVGRRPLLLLVSSNGLLPLILPARDVATIPARLPGLVATALRRMGVATHLIESEVAAMSPVVIAPTRDRSVVGVLVDTAKTLPYHFESGAWDDTTLPFVQAQLADTPWHCGGRWDQVVFPRKAVPDLLQRKWENR